MKKTAKKPVKTKKTVRGRRRIGLLHSGSRDHFNAPVAALKYALLPLDVEVVEKYAADLPGDINSNLVYLAEGLVQDSTVAGPDKLEALVAAGGPTPALLLQELTKNLPNPKPPIVFTTVVTPDELGLVKTLATPTYNLTGMAGQTSELDPDRLHMLFALAKTKISKGDKIGVLVSDSRPDKDKHVKKIKDKADGTNLKLKLRRRDVTDKQEIENAFVGFKDEPVKGVVVTADSLFNDLRKDVVRCANEFWPSDDLSMEGICGIGRADQFRARYSGGLRQGRRIRKADSQPGKPFYNVVLVSITIQGLCELRNRATAVGHHNNPDNAAWLSC